ncbi:hypothetical protein [Paenibacillus thalictri]|uniref:Apea-like HEPN domain-containing protein n=1 Tax=Paenibacillus thalictri TaxID=2527873 RepID=A0A4Q9DE66_9BACL|nr:hypothetical protein [Paenibacillus thalictri]TBL69774.1 hypothetical protein EYB31_34930 [Paenibacillus thalictri]
MVVLLNEEDQQRIHSHLNRAERPQNDLFDSYTALWSAFNVMYEALRPEMISSGKKSKDLSERSMAKYCAKKLEYATWSRLFNTTKLDKLLSIAPIFNERDWIREAKINITEYSKLVDSIAIARSNNNDCFGIELLEALIDFLYVIRCNLFHGFKTPELPRDQEVLGATEPLLREIVFKLNEKFS